MMKPAMNTLGDVKSIQLSISQPVTLPTSGVHDGRTCLATKRASFTLPGTNHHLPGKNTELRPADTMGVGFVWRANEAHNTHLDNLPKVHFLFKEKNV